MVTGAYYPELAGGSLQCRSLVLALRDRVRFTVLTTTHEHEARGRSEVDGIAVHRVFIDPRSWRTKITGGCRMGRVAAALARECDIFHFHGFTEKMLLLAAIARLFGRRTIEKLTSLGWDDPVSIRRRRFGPLLAFAQARASRIVAMNAALREQCRRAGIADASVVSIPNGVDPARFMPVDERARVALRQRLGLPPESVLVTFVGFWSAEKGPAVLFDAWLRARRDTGTDAAMLFIGSTSAEHPEVDPHLVASVQQRIRDEDLGSRVFFVERTDDVATYLQASDIFALPSAREGLSNALLEAMATGLACVSVDIPGATDSVIDAGSNGWLVPPGDASALAAVLSRLFRDGDLRQLAGGRARATVLARFTIGDVADRYCALYCELMGRA
jgi:glycosyltransferase involved in cell wall biosynthesis